MLDLAKLENPWKLSEIPATPFYIYSESHLEALTAAYKKALAGSQIGTHFALKSNNNPQVLKFFKAQGFGLDLVSGGELKIALANGFRGAELIFSGVGKSTEELSLALDSEVELIIVESRSELERLAKIAQLKQKKAPVALRVNPDVDAKTHPYISTGMYEHKFGVDFTEAKKLYHFAHGSPYLQIQAMSVHIGSQMLDLSALQNALSKSLEFARELQREGIYIPIFDTGGGVGIHYEEPSLYPPFERYGEILKAFSIQWAALQPGISKVYTEVGRALVSQAGFLITRVIGTKKNARKNFAIVDASMTELLRPALYQAVHPIDVWAQVNSDGGAREAVVYDVVGPVCESSDVLGKARTFLELDDGDCLQIGCTGAYGYVMASHYNARAIPAEWWIAKTGQLTLSRAPIACPF